MRSNIICILRQNIRIIKSRRIGWVEHVVCKGAKRKRLKFLVDEAEGKTH
jgi:hypothetical protein